MNLEKLNLVELNAQELQETDGGSWGRLYKFIVDTVVGMAGEAVLTQAANSLNRQQREDYYHYRAM